MSWRLADSHVVGCMCAPWSSAPLARDAVVLTNDEHPDTCLIFARKDASGDATGERMTIEDWKQLVASEDVIKLAEPLALGSTVGKPACWRLHGNYPDREQAAHQLRGCADALIHEQRRGDALIMIVDEAHTPALLDSWSRAAFDQAWRLGQRGEWQAAHQQADLAWLTNVTLDIDRVALLALTTEHTEGPSAAEDLIAFELNSRKSRPEHELRQRIGDYRAQFFPRSARSAPLLASVAALEARGKVRNVSQWRSNDRSIFRLSHGAGSPRAVRAS